MLFSSPQSSEMKARFANWRLVFPTLAHNHVPYDFTQVKGYLSSADPTLQEKSAFNAFRESIFHVGTIVKSEIEALHGKPQNVVLGGIGMGCATALWTLLAHHIRLGGLVGVNGWLPLLQAIAKWTLEEIKQDFCLPLDDEASSASVDYRDSDQHVWNTPILLGHRGDEEMVRIEAGREAKHWLETKGFLVEWCEYQRGQIPDHWLPDSKELDDIMFLLECSTDVLDQGRARL